MKAKYPKQESWKILYARFDGVQRRAVELLNREIGKRLIRKQGIYTLYVLPCEKEGAESIVDKNAMIIGLYRESAWIQKFVKEEEIPQDGYLVRIVDNPTDTDCSIVLITAKTDVALYYGSCAYVMPWRVNGKKGRFYDPFANDQDFALYFAMKITENRE